MKSSVCSSSVSDQSLIYKHYRVLFKYTASCLHHITRRAHRVKETDMPKKSEIKDPAFLTIPGNVYPPIPISSVTEVCFII